MIWRTVDTESFAMMVSGSSLGFVVSRPDTSLLEFDAEDDLMHAGRAV
jgi:hypothetical protein